MADARINDRDLVSELRRVDDAFSQLKPSRDDLVEALLAGDADVVIAEGSRRLRVARARKAVVALGGACALVATIFVVAPIAVDHRRTPTHALAAAPSTTNATTTTKTTTTTTLAVAHTAATSALAPQRPTPVVTSTRPQLWQPVSMSASAPQSPAMMELSSTAVAPVQAASPHSLRRMNPRSLDVRVQGLAEAAPDVVTDDDVQAAVVSARTLAARGAYLDAADALGALLARGPGGRVADVVLSEQASLLTKAGRTEQACALWTKHRARFSSSSNSAAVVAALSRHQCP